MGKINVAELLRNCPQGMELDCTMFDDVKFIAVDEAEKPICIRTGVAYRFLTKFGTWTFDENAKCVIFPKGKTTWEGFIPPCKFKDGDIIYIYSASPWICIYKEGGEKQNVYYKYVAMSTSSFVHDRFPLCHRSTVKEIRHATEEEKQKLLQEIKDRGYKWNTETKTLEELVEPKEDTENKTVMAGIYFDREYYADEVELHLGNYEIEIRGGKTYAVLKNQETKISKPNFKVGDRIKHRLTGEVYMVLFVLSNGDGGGVYDVAVTNEIGKSIDIKEQDNYELVHNKFDITTLKPFESRVLVRDNKSQKWSPAIWGFYDPDARDYQYKLVGIIARYCIPYEGNEHLLGTTDDCDEFYKIS